MIKLTKAAIPAILASKAQAWTTAILTKQGAGEKLTDTDKRHYAHPDIKLALVEETHGKCAYCESKMRHVAPGDVEHVVPKSAVPARWFDWSNLTLACDTCNGNKLDSHGNLVDPYASDPEDQFWFTGPIIWARPASEAASITERLLELNRVELLERRGERLIGLKSLIEIVERTIDPNLKKILQDDLQNETLDDREYAAMSREFLRFAAQKLVPTL